MAIQTAHGTTLEIATHAWQNNFKLLSFDWTGVSREVYETTDMSVTNGRTFIASKTYDPGECTFTCQYDPDAAIGLTNITTTTTVSVEVKIGGEATCIDCEATGFITNVDRSGAADPDGDIPSIVITYKMTGDLGDTTA